MWSALWLISLPPYSEIFVLYIILTLVVVPAFFIAGERYRLLALATSGVIWVGAQNFSDFLAPLTHHLAPKPTCLAVPVRDWAIRCDKAGTSRNLYYPCVRNFAGP